MDNNIFVELLTTLLLAEAQGDATKAHNILIGIAIELCVMQAETNFDGALLLAEKHQRALELVATELKAMKEGVKDNDDVIH